MQYKAHMQASNSKAGPEDLLGSVDIAERIRAARARVGLTRKQLATASGASERYLAHLEAGTGNPSVEMLLSVADALGIAIADLLPLGGERDPLVAQVAALLRRMPPDRIRELLVRLGNQPGDTEGKGRRIALIGMRGAGKTSLGSALAKRLNAPFFEVSKEVERRCGGTIAVLLEMNGARALHRYESEVLASICSNNSMAVIAAPGAIVADGKLYDQLRQSAWTVWLKANPDDHMERVIAQGDLRPMSESRAAMNDLKAILLAREVAYGQADAQVDTSAQDLTSTLGILEELATQLIA
ncbi:helix-turn-helix domain-containing protein [Erythrobacteraceae bacterium E2-1 Yellow Sea]|jgi:XRE family aerobic/anaerobic benzoate catabolism transcriptional regulator|nr:helix-turn-helix domain-containing protein [Erythrobacteraceae bacterium E2-1 Yellow Sea]